MGVRRAVDTAEEILRNTNSGLVYTMGPLIHNPVVLKSLEKRGLHVLEEKNIYRLDEKNTVVIRAHGISPLLFNRLEKQGCTIIDATCPRVKVSQRRAEEYSKRGYTVILTGDKNHGEVTGIAGFAGKNFLLVQTIAAAELLFTGDNMKCIPEKAILLSQTTFSPVDFEAIAGILKRKIPALEVFNTICPATEERQTALRKLSLQVDGILVVGGRNSANTRRLYTNAESLCRKSALIETPEEIPEYFFTMNVIGITAGASTPDEVITAVEETLLKK